MATTMVTVGGTDRAEETTPSPESSRGLLLVVVGLLAGAVLGVLFTGNAAEDRLVAGRTVVSEPEATPTTAVPLTTTTTDVAPSRLATMVPGMLDVLVASAVDRNGMPVVSTWQPAGPAPTVKALPWGDLIVDASRNWLAFGGTNRWVVGDTLWVGNSAYMEPVSTSLVSGPVWHIRYPGEVAWIEDAAEGRTLTTARFVPGQPAIARPVTRVDESIQVVGWTDAGFLTRGFDEKSSFLEVRDVTGAVEEAVEISKFPVTVGPNLVSATDPAGSGVLLDHDLKVVGMAPWGGDCQRAQWGPNGLAVTVHCGIGGEQRFEFWQDPVSHSDPLFVHTGREYTDFGFTSIGLPYVAWIDALRPASTILFYHPADGRSYEVNYPGRVQWLETINN